MTAITEDNCTRIFEAISRSERPYELVPFIRQNPLTQEDFMVAMRPVNVTELQKIEAAGAAAAKKFAKDNGLSMNDPGVEVIQSNARVVELLWYAIRNPDDLNKPAFLSPAELARCISSHEFTLLINQYSRVEAELSPLIGTMTEEEVQEWIRLLGKGGEAASNFLDRMSWVMRKALMISMACQLIELKTDTDSSGMPAEDESNNENKSEESKTA